MNFPYYYSVIYVKIKYDVTKDFTQSRTFEEFKKLGHVIYKVGGKESEFTKAATDLFIMRKPFIYEKVSIWA